MSAASAPSSPPASNTTAPPPSTPSAPPPDTPSAAPPDTPSAPPPATPSAPPPATPSAPPPATPSAPPPATPSASPPAPTTPSTSPPAPTTPSTSPPSPSPPSLSPPSPGGGKITPAPPSRFSPPPPHSPSTPKTPSSSKSPPSRPPSSGSGISTGLVVGIAAGAVAVVLVLSILCICCRKKKRRRDEELYYPPPPQHQHQQKVDPYGAPPHQWQYNAPPPSDHVVPVMPKPSPMPPLASTGQSSQIYVPAQPPPPPPFVSSSVESGSNYSAGEPHPPPSPALSLGFIKSTFLYEELLSATDGFSNANLLGSGGFGYVHRGILPNGKEVAVKQLKAGSGQGEREFQAEVEIISRVHHKHLVSLVGYCINGTRRLLVYEFVPNNTLEFHLHGKGRPTMDWSTRLRIALGSAKGLAYLHEDCHPKIIHRDIKAANILLDFKFEAKVADFGLAKIASEVNTHVSTRVMGTFGYLAPEYASTGKLTDKSDVFSYGVMLLELITGRRPVDIHHNYAEDSLVDWARPVLTRSLEEDDFDSLIDPRLQNEFNRDDLARMVACAAACIRYSAKRRPRMSQVVRALEGVVSLEDLNDGTRPGHSTAYSSYGSSDYDTSQYKEDMKKFRKAALEGTQEYGASSGYSAPTSEYGLYPSGSSNEGQSRQTTREMEMNMVKNAQVFSSGKP
ncbi:PREDICTED: proline-rich receptor-like protein kinase PERK1 [Lupinus angustifolius]|nr:PREDICTED: proline-rich receptor-like protein kinase PERK1 [Lupinus angustifolius]